MGLREELSKRILRKEEEIRSLQLQIREAQAYVQGLQDTLKIIPRDGTGGSPETVLRPGSTVAKAVEALRAAGHPLHIGELLKAIGKQVNRENRSGLSGSIAAYVRKGEIFTRPAPNTFGLVSFDPAGTPLPEGFGRIEEDS